MSVRRETARYFFPTTLMKRTFWKAALLVAKSLECCGRQKLRWARSIVLRYEHRYGKREEFSALTICPGQTFYYMDTDSVSELAWFIGEFPAIKPYVADWVLNICEEAAAYERERKHRKRVRYREKKRLQAG